MTYDYREALGEDIMEYIENEVDLAEWESLEDLEDFLRDELWTVDSVTGNGSGSYTFSTWTAEENLCHNLDLLGEALQEFGCGPEYLMEHGPEACDVTIRCYLLGEVLGECIAELEDEWLEARGEGVDAE
jgi:hypothetical protein